MMIPLGRWIRGASLLIGATIAVAQEDDIDLADFMGDGYGGDYGNMEEMMKMMGGMGYGGMGYGGMGYGGYGYGDTGPAHTDLTDMADVEKFIADDPDTPAVVGYYNEDLHGDSIMTYRTVAERMSHTDIRFGLATEDDVLEALKYTSGRVMAYPAERFLDKETDRSKHRYPASSLSAEPLQKWISKACTPLVGMLTWETGGRYQEVGLPEVTAFMKVDLEENRKEWDDVTRTLRAVASSKAKGKLSFNVADVSTMSPLASAFQIEADESGEDEVRVGIRRENAFYRMDEDFSEKALKTFVEAFLQGTLKPIHVEDMGDAGMDNMEGDEEEEEDGDVVVLNSSNFDDVVNEPGKDVMVEFYAPWCGHCQHLKPVYSELATEFADSPNVVVAKMNADVHRPPETYEVQGFPTLYFVKAGDKNHPIPYEGPRDHASLAAFIRDNSQASPEATVEL